MEKEKTIAALRDSGAMLEGHFLLSSGRHADTYFQCAKLLQYPERAAAVLEPVATRIRSAMRNRSLALCAVVGPALGGIIVAYELGRQLGLPALFTERDSNGCMALRRGFAVPAGGGVLIAEDVVTTAASSRETARVLEELGSRVAALACVVDRRAPDTPLEWPLYAACALEAATWAPEDCPLCARNIPWVKPGSRNV
ncbi:MAG: orotate phosphoribosyltransferase [Spirochaetaceae bacterium]|jgi:orotate phosphoribosyltransferase|nr:orotate phosphoribosyltransferase [Spirochaetaceae bacterium]